jgi:hypothetical protein
MEGGSKSSDTVLFRDRYGNTTSIQLTRTKLRGFPVYVTVDGYFTTAVVRVTTAGLEPVSLKYKEEEIYS